MNSKLLKISIVLTMSGLIIFVLSVSALELGHVSLDSSALTITPALVLINIFSTFIGIPVFLFGIAFMIGSFVTRLSSFYVISMSGIILVSAWIFFIFLRFS